MSARAAVIALSLALASPAGAADALAGREIHGESDAFAAEGVAIAWAILRAPNLDDATVVMRVVKDDARYPALGVDAVDPFGGGRQAVRAAAAVTGTVDVSSRRGRFAEFARTEFRLYASARPAASEAPVLTVFYQGVPDTTPEFDSEAKLRAWLDERIARLRPAAGGTTR